MKRVFSIDQIKTDLESKNISVERGGISLSAKNHNCTSRINLAIIVPYRDRVNHLKLFLANMHPFLTRQRINYGIYLIEPLSGLTFNRGILKNIGYVESLKDQSEWNCIMFHDVDFYPENNKNFYKCNDLFPTHFAVSVQQFGYERFKNV